MSLCIYEGKKILIMRSVSIALLCCFQCPQSFPEFEFDWDDPDANKSHFVVPEGETITLPCRVGGDPRPTITWFVIDAPALTV